MTSSSLTSSLIMLAKSGIRGQVDPKAEYAALNPPLWDELTALAEAHGLLGMMGTGAEAANLIVPEKTTTLLRRTRRINAMRFDRAWRQIAEIVEAWEQSGIESVHLKGVSFAARHYPTPEMRAFGDIDLLILPHERDQAADVLVQLGYRCTDDLDSGGKEWCLANHFHWKFMREGAFPVELHWKLTFSFPPTPADLTVIWARTLRMSSPAGEIRCLEPEDEVLALAAHMTSHCFRLPLRCHADIMALVRNFTPEQWENLWERAVKMEQQRDILAVLGVGNRLGLTDLPVAMMDRIAADRTLDLKFLVEYALGCPFVAAPERWLDVQNAPTQRAALGRIWHVFFPRYTHLWTPQGEVQSKSRPALVYAAAWIRRAARLFGRLRNLPQLAADCRQTARVHKMFGDRRRTKASGEQATDLNSYDDPQIKVQ